MLASLQRAGITTEDALALRRIAMTLHRWFELECGDGNNYGSWCITRGRKVNGSFEHDDDGKPYLEHHHWGREAHQNSVSYAPLADRETGAKKRLAAIMARYPALSSYIQTDPRGASLYILPQGVDAENYNRGVAVYK